MAFALKIGPTSEAISGVEVRRRLQFERLTSIEEDHLRTMISGGIV